MAEREGTGDGGGAMKSQPLRELSTPGERGEGIQGPEARGRAPTAPCGQWGAPEDSAGSF